MRTAVQWRSRETGWVFMHAADILFIWSRDSSQMPDDANSVLFSRGWSTLSTPSHARREEKNASTPPLMHPKAKMPPVWRASCHSMRVEAQSIVLADAPFAWLSLGVLPVQAWKTYFSAPAVRSGRKSTMMDSESREFCGPTDELRHKCLCSGKLKH
jgi:hypothetical protein